MQDTDFFDYEFGGFRLDPRRRSLSKNGENVPISARNFDLLLFMVASGGRILEHDELLDKVWAGTFVEQATLTKGVSALRQILSETSGDQHIQTIPRRGYVFVSPVRIVRGSNASGLFEEARYDAEGPEAGIKRNPVAPGRRYLTVLKKYRISLALGAIVLLLLAGFQIWMIRSRSSPRFSFENLKIGILTKKGTLNGAVISPTGSYFLYATIENDGSSLWVQQVATGGATRLTPKMRASFWYYTFSPDDSYVYYTVNNNSEASQNGLFKVPLFGGSPQRVSETPYAIFFSPDGGRIAYVGIGSEVGRIFTASPDFSDKKLITTFSEDYRIWSVQWSPDGKSLLFALRRFTADKTVHYVVEFPIDGGKETVIVPEMEKQVTSAAWLPDKSSLLLCLREVNAEVRQIWQFFPPSGEFKRITNDNNSYKGFSITGDGKTIVTLSENSYAAIWTAEDEKYGFRQITSGLNNFGVVGWTADGRIIYSSTENGVEVVSIIDADGSKPLQITTGNDGVRLYPRISSDGRSVLFASTRTGLRQLWRVDLDGRNLAQLTQTGDIYAFDGKLLSDNQTIVFLGEGKGAPGILYKQTRDGAVTSLGDESVRAWDISPDEKLLAYSAIDKDTRKTRLFIKSLDSGRLIKSFDIQPHMLLRWTRDGKAVTYDTVDGDSSQIFTQPIENGDPKMLARFQAEQIYWFDWSLDGKKLAIIRGKQLNDAVLIRTEDKSH